MGFNSGFKGLICCSHEHGLRSTLQVKVQHYLFVALQVVNTDGSMMEAGFPGRSPRKKTGCATKICTSQTPLWQHRSETLWVPSPSDICQTGNVNT